MANLRFQREPKENILYPEEFELAQLQQEEKELQDLRAWVSKQRCKCRNCGYHNKIWDEDVVLQYSSRHFNPLLSDHRAIHADKRTMSTSGVIIWHCIQCEKIELQTFMDHHTNIAFFFGLGILLAGLLFLIAVSLV